MKWEREDLTAEGWEDYELLDSGDGMRLERFGAIVLCRPAQQAIWPRSLPHSVWDGADATFVRDPSGKGQWTERRKLPAEWKLRFGALCFALKTTSFGHIGFFAEQQPCWTWVRERALASSAPLSILNLFAYTGSMTLASAAAGARVCHLDASPPVVEWARKNAERSGMESAPIRWIVDEAIKFTGREARRGHRYDAIILDPPSFGRGPKGEVFKLEQDLGPLLDECRKLLSDAPSFLLLSCHTPGITGVCLANLLAHAGGRLRSGELLIASSRSRAVLPSGSYAIWTPG